MTEALVPSERRLIEEAEEVVQLQLSRAGVRRAARRNHALASPDRSMARNMISLPSARRNSQLSIWT